MTAQLLSPARSAGENFPSAGTSPGQNFCFARRYSILHVYNAVLVPLRPPYSVNTRVALNPGYAWMARDGVSGTSTPPTHIGRRRRRGCRHRRRRLFTPRRNNRVGRAGHGVGVGLRVGLETRRR